MNPLHIILIALILSLKAGAQDNLPLDHLKNAGYALETEQTIKPGDYDFFKSMEINRTLLDSIQVKEIKEYSFRKRHEKTIYTIETIRFTIKKVVNNLINHCLPLTVNSSNNLTRP